MTKWMCSADSHILEPGDLWATRLPKSLRDRAPRIEVEGRYRVYYAEGRRRMKVPNDGDYLAEGKPVPIDVAGRLKMLEQDGVWAETIIGAGAANIVLSLEDAELAIASACIYNDYLAETYGPYRDRELGLGLIPIQDPRLAVKEIQRVASMGLAGITLPIAVREPYFLEKYEPIWAAANEHRLPISFHAGTGWSNLGVPGFTPGAKLKSERAQDGKKTAAAMVLGNEAFQVTASLVGAGVLERYPALHIVLVETGAGWLVSAMEAMDFAWVDTPGQNDRGGSGPILYDSDGTEIVVAVEEIPFWGGNWRYPLSPSEYVRRQVHATFQDEPAPIKFRHAIGISSLLWGSDFPHVEGTWPHSRSVVDRLFADVDETERSAITGGTFAALYGVDVPA